MLALYKNIKNRRLELNMTQSDLAQKLGYADKSMIAKIEKGLIDLPQSKILSFAEVLQISPGDLMGLDAVISSSNTQIKPVSVDTKRHAVTIKVLGRVAAGIPIEAVEDVIDTEEITEELARTGNYFGLLIHGDSMEPDIRNGDVVIVRQQDDAESGEIVIALINGDDACCKRLVKYAGGIGLISLNTKYSPMMFSETDIADKPVHIIGKVVELRRKF